jgi:adenylate cyclase
LALLLSAHVLAAALLTGGLMLHGATSAVDELAERLGSELADRISVEIREVLEAPHLVNQINADAIGLIEDPDFSHPPAALEALFVHQLTRFPVTLSYMGTPNGEYLGTRRMSGQGFTLSISGPETNLINRRFEVVDGARGPEILQGTSRFVPTTRPWYQAAEAAGGPVWTELYPDFFTGVPAITAAYPVYDADGELMVILGSDLLLDHVGRLLAEQALGDGGFSLLVEADGDLVANSLGLPSIGEEDLLQLSEIDEPRMAQMADHLDLQGTQLVELGGEPHYVQVQPYTDDRGLDWRVVVAIPRSQLMGRVEEGLQWTVLLTSLAVLLAGVLAVWLAGRVSRPLQVLAEELGRVARFDLTGKDRPVSPLREIATIQDATGTMKSGLSAFEKYVPRDLVQDLVMARKGARLGLEPAQVTLYFSDVAGFTTISEQLGDAELVDLMGEYLGAMSEVVLQGGGTIDKFIGDAVMAFWNAPHEQDDHALLACQAALRSQSRLAELRETWTERGLPPLRARIGLHVGPVRVGNLGSEQRMNYTVIGDSVNLAARLEALNKAYGSEILISQALWEQVQFTLRARPLESVRVAGKRNAITVYELLGEDVDEARITASTRAFEAWTAGDFETAVAVLDAHLAADPEDAPARRVRDRAVALRDDPPAEWDGAVDMPK